MPRSLWQPKVSHARFAVGAFSAEQMLTLGDILAGSIRDRIASGLNAADVPALPLRPTYQEAKTKKGLAAVRNWTWSGNTLRALRCIAANENRAQVSFNNPVAGRIAHFNNLRERAFGVSPRNRQLIVAAVNATARQARVVRVSKGA